MTIPSPSTRGIVTTRVSIAWPSTVSDTRPSCGTRFSAMSRLAMIFTRETVPAIMRFGICVVSRSTPSTRKRTRISRPSGSKWMSEAPSSTAWAMIELTSLMTGASSADSRISVTSASSSSPSWTASATASSSRLMRRDQPVDVVGRGDHRAHLAARAQLQVVEREHVRRIRHRDEQPARVVVADRRRAQPARHLRRDHVERPDVRLEEREVDVVEAEALGDRARELVARDHARLEQRLLGGAAGRLGLVDDRLHPLARQEAQLDDHVGDRARAAALRLLAASARQPERGRRPRQHELRRAALRLGHRASATTWTSDLEST